MNGKKVDIPSYRVSQYDIIDVRDEVAEQTLPFQVPVRPRAIARSRAGCRSSVDLRILVHQLPERAQIDVPLQEQLIVEYYSK